MAITLTSAYLAELNKSPNSPNIIIEAAIQFTQFLADGTYLANGSITAVGSESAGVDKWGFSLGGFSDVMPILKSVSSLQNKIDAKSGYATQGQITIVISGRDYIKTLVGDEFLKNRRITRYDGFTSDGFQYSDYAPTFTGIISDWSRKGDELTIVVSDENIKTNKKIPVETTTQTEFIDYRNTNPVDIMQNILKTQLGIDPAFVDDVQFDLEQATWFSGWIFDRVITKPEQGSKYLNELQMETNSFLIHDGEKISFRHFAPPVPGQSVPHFTDDNHILDGTFSQKSGYRDQFFNRVIVYYDYDESGSDKPENFEAAYIATDVSSQSSGEWDETKTKTFKSKWIRTHTYTQSSNITGVTLYHVSQANDIGSGTLDYNKANNTLTWTAPSGSVGDTVTLDNDGKYQIFDSSQAKWVRVVVDVSALPSADKSDSIVLTSLDGETYAAYVANKNLAKFRNPVSTINFSIDINSAVAGDQFLKPADIIDMTTDEAFSKDFPEWIKERMLITSFRPDFNMGVVKIEAIQTKMRLSNGYIAPAGYPDHDTATELQREYAFIGRASDNKVFDGTDFVDGKYIW